MSDSLINNVLPNGTVPNARISTAGQAWAAYSELLQGDSLRDGKRKKLYGAKNRHRPTDQATLEEQGIEDSTNVNWGQLSLGVDQISSIFYDYVSERDAPANIEVDTVKQEFDPTLDIQEAQRYSVDITKLFSKTLMLSKWFLPMLEMQSDDLSLYGSTFAYWPDQSDWVPDFLANGSILLPNKASTDVEKWEIAAVKTCYTETELFKKIRNHAEAEQIGWNIDAVVTKLSSRRSGDDRFHQTGTDCLETIQRINRGEVVLEGSASAEIQVIELYVKEFDDSITKLIFFADSSVNESTTVGDSDTDSDRVKNNDGTPMRIPVEGTSSDSAEDNGLSDSINPKGFAFSRPEFAKSMEDVFSILISSSGGGKIHEIRSYGEQLFAQSESYDRFMNSAVDGALQSAMLMFQGTDEDAIRKMRQTTMRPFAVLPPTASLVQVPISVDISKMLGTNAQLKEDLEKGIGLLSESSASGNRSGTKGEAELRESQKADLVTGQLNKFNVHYTALIAKLYKKFITLSGSDDEARQRFDRSLEASMIPLEASLPESVNILPKSVSAAGSRSAKIVAARGINEFVTLGSSATTRGQWLAARDGVAAYGGSASVETYLPSVRFPKDGFDARDIGIENELMRNPNLNLANIRPTSVNVHTDHIRAHILSVSEDIASIDAQNRQPDGFDPDANLTVLAFIINAGRHIQEHINMISQNPELNDFVKTANSDLAQIAAKGEEIRNILQQFRRGQQQAAEASQQGVSGEAEQKLATQRELSQIRLAEQQQLSQIRREEAVDSAALQRMKSQENEPS